MNIALWIVQAVVSILFGMAGSMKLMTPIAELTEKMVWPGSLPEPLVRFIGGCELAGAIGLILPAVTRIKPVLTPLAAAGLATIMMLAALFHFSRGEYLVIAFNLVLGSLAAFVAWGRYRKLPIPPRH